MSDKVFKESGAIQVLSIQMSKQGVNEFTLANNEILLAVFCQGRGDVTFSEKKIFAVEKEYVMICGGIGRNEISVCTEDLPESQVILVVLTGICMPEKMKRGCLRNQSSKIVSMLIREIGEKQFGYVSNCESLINMLLILLHRECNQAEERLTDLERRKYCEKVNSYVQKHYLDNPSMEFLANKFGYSGNAQMLRRDFLRFYGVTPVAISKVKKLEEAKRLLVTTTYSMNEIAVILKYKSNTHFGADFKRSTGMTPVEYRKNIRAEREKQIQAENHQMNLEEYLAKTCRISVRIFIYSSTFIP